MIRRLVSCLGLAAALVAPAAAQEGPSFDCRLARSATEQAICASAELSRIERRMVEAYEAAAARIGRSAARSVADEQLARREACGADPDCIAERLTVALGMFLGLADPEPDAPEPPAPGPLTVLPGGLAPLPPEGLEIGGQPLAPRVQPAAAAPASALRPPARPAGLGAAPVLSPVARAFLALPDWRRQAIEGRLAQAGFHRGAVDGVWDEATAAAIDAFVRRARDDGFIIDPDSGEGAVQVLSFIDSDPFRRRYLGETFRRPDRVGD